MFMQPTRSLVRIAKLSLLTILCSAGNAAFATAGFYSGTIDFCYQFPDFGNLAYGPGPAAIGSAGDLWNSTYLLTGLNTLFDTTGATTDVSWVFSTGIGYGYTLGGTYGRLFSSFNGFNTATITGLTPNEQYNLYLYGNSFYANSLTVNGVSFSVPLVVDASTLNPGIQYDVETVRADSSGQLTFTPTGSLSSFVSSWQLTPVPEPQSSSLLSVAAISLFGFSLRRKKHSSKQNNLQTDQSVNE